MLVMSQGRGWDQQREGCWDGDRAGAGTLTKHISHHLRFSPLHDPVQALHIPT